MKKRLVALMLTMGMVLGLAACGGSGSSSDQSGGNASSGSEDGGDLPVLKVAVMPFLNCLPVQYMIENGLDEENGFKIETRPFVTSEEAKGITIGESVIVTGEFRVSQELLEESRYPEIATHIDDTIIKEALGF